MSTWGVEQVAKWARGAGWRGDEIVTATALAMAASNGDDHHDSNPSMVPDLERRGLYALRSSEAPGIDFGTLFDPVVCTRAAHAFWRDMGGTWSWHPVWASGAAMAALPHVRAVLARPDQQPAAGAARTFAAMMDYRGKFQTAMQQQRR